MKIWHVSDTHGHHDQLEIPKDIDVMVFSGDESNYHSPAQNEFEFFPFLDWMKSIDIPHKLMIAGNHSSFIFNNKKYCKRIIAEAGIEYLEHDYAEIGGFKFFGDPYTPTFNSWYFMADRAKMDKRWADIDSGVDVIITHGPPYGILDVTVDRNHNYDLCGDKALLRHVQRVGPALHLFGHIHDCQDIVNFGIRELNQTKYSNGAVVKDGRFGTIYHNGSVMEL